LSIHPAQDYPLPQHLTKAMDEVIASACEMMLSDADTVENVPHGCAGEVDAGTHRQRD
jgi:hypothetical protein